MARESSAATDLVGGAVGRIDFPTPATSEALVEIAHRLEVEYPRQVIRTMAIVGAGCRLTSPDNLWSVWLTPTSITLGTKASQTSEELITRLERIATPVEAVLVPEAYDRVELRYLQAGPFVEPPPFDVLAPIGAPGERTEELTQTVRGSLPHSRFVLRYGVHPVAAETFYVADARVFTESVPQQELSKVLHILEHDSMSLLSGVPNVEIRPVSVGDIEWISCSFGPMLPWELFHQFQGHGEPVLGAMLGSSVRDPVDSINESRLRLLARKSSDLPFSQEDEIHLHELTEKVRRLLPRVTDRAFEELVNVASRTDELADTVRQIREKYGLDDT